MRAARLAPTLLLGALVAHTAPLGAQSLDAGRSALHSGDYAEAIANLLKVPAADSGWLDAQHDLARAYLTTGKYDDAENVARRAAASKNGAAMANTLGEVLVARGKQAAAESAFVRAQAEHAPDSLTAALNLAILHYDRGDRDRAMKEFDHFIDVYNTTVGAGLTSEEVADVGIAVEYLGPTDPQLFKDALKAFDRALRDDPSNDDARAALGELFLAKYNFADAQQTFEEILQSNPHDPRALLGAARRREADGQPGADSLLRAALEVNPEYAPARTLHAEMLVSLEDYAGAEQDVVRALRVNPTYERALAVDAAIKFLTHDQAGFDAARQRALAVNPHDAELYATLAELAGNVRLYSAAAGFAKQAIALDPKDWRAWSLLGMNELRTGQIDSGKKSLDTSFAGDPYDVWVKNTLDLLDTYKNYDLVSSGHFQFMIEKDESPILSIYLADLAEKAYARYSKEYGFIPAPPIRIEVYRSHADFSVRTVGLAGLGALGVSFGTTLAFDSPAAKDAGPFNWGSTVWHELGHTFTLGLTDNRVPRWFSEGLSVYEEHHGLTGWGFQVTPDFLAAYKAGRLVPVSRMNDGFMHPVYPEQVQFSYYQASMVCDLIARDFGADALVKMLQAYKTGATTEQVFQMVLHTDLANFDKRFDDYLRTTFAQPLAAIDTAPSDFSKFSTAAEIEALATRSPKDFGVQLFAGEAFVGNDSLDKGIAYLERARALFPQYGGPHSPYALLAAAYRTKGDTAKEIDMLREWTSRDETAYDALERLGALLEKRGDRAGAVDALNRAMYVNPFEVAPHAKLAELASASGDKQLAVRERRAVVALGPIDRAEALYQLAMAQHDAGDDTGARKSVLRSLEEAPNYVKAQDLLLLLHDARTRQSGVPKP